MISFLLGIYVGGAIAHFCMIIYEDCPLSLRIHDSLFWPVSLAQYMIENKEDNK